MPDCVIGGAHSSSLKTSDFYKTCNLPKRFDYTSWFTGYGSQNGRRGSPMYRTTAQQYGWLPPSPHTVPTVYYPLDSSFSNAYHAFGKYKLFF